MPAMFEADSALVTDVRPAPNVNERVGGPADMLDRKSVV